MPPAKVPRGSLPELREAVQSCRACDLWKDATQAVFGEGSPDARMMLVGEQPGDHEDREGHPFVGPAGGVLSRALQEAGIDRDEVYLTNVVKHFKYRARGTRRIHQKPGAIEIRACRPWVEAEIERVQPQVLVCLGATAGQALLGNQVRIGRDRGRPLPSDLAPSVLLTAHPSAILRQPTPQAREEAFEALSSDLALAASSP